MFQHTPGQHHRQHHLSQSLIGVDLAPYDVGVLPLHHAYLVGRTGGTVHVWRVTQRLACTRNVPTSQQVLPLYSSLAICTINSMLFGDSI